VRKPICPGLSLTAALLSLAGCARFESRPLDVARTARQFDERTLGTPELRRFIETNSAPLAQWPPEQWDFGQLTLCALFLHPSLDVARAELASARAAEITAGARPNPTVGVTPEYTINPAGGASPWIATIQFDLPIETAGKRQLRVARAKRLSEAARLRLGSVAWEICSGVRSALLDLGGALERTTLLKRQLTAQERVLSALETKLAQGAATSTDLAPSRIALARTRSDLADARAASGEARARLAAAIGVPLNSLPPNAALPTEISTDAALDSNEARRRALTSRADLLSALAEYAAAETALKLEIRRQYPDVHLGTGYQFDQGENKWALGLTAELPLLNQNQGPIAEAEAKRAAAAARVLALQARIVGDVDRALAVWRGAQARSAALLEVRTAQQSRLKSLRTQFEAGAVETLDVLEAESQLAAAEILYWEAQVKAWRAFADLEDSIQFPLPLDLSRNPRRPEP
jgi:outer membrane protein, heavy metal efflux system